MAPISAKLQRGEHSPLKESSRIGHLHEHNASPMLQQQNAQHLRQLHQRHYLNTKENTIIDNTSNTNRYVLKNKSVASSAVDGGGVSKHMKSGLEILDFHESWLEEVELYKDQLNQRRHYFNQTNTKSNLHTHTNKSNGHYYNGNTAAISSITQVQPNQQQQLQQFQQIFQYQHTAAENNCQHESHNCNATLANKPHNINFQGMGVIDHYNEENPYEKSASPATPLSNGHGGNLRLSSKRVIIKKREPQQQQQQSQQQSQQFSRNIKHSQIRAVPLLAAATLQTQLSHLNELDVPAPVLDLLKNAEKQLYLKRPREDATLTLHNSSNNNNNNNNAHIKPTSSNNQSNVIKHFIRDPPISTNNNNNRASGSPKVIVNQFHAINILNSCQNEEKTQILRENGLNKSAASAYETSVYASNYINSNNNIINHNRPYVDYGYGDRSRAGSSPNYHPDDPSSAIDETSYSDDDTDEEYVGEPLYLKEDGAEICQSRTIRHGPDFDRKLSASKQADKQDGESQTPLDDLESLTSQQTVYGTPKCILTPSLFPNVPPYLNFASHAEKGPEMPTALHKVLKWKLSPCMPRIVKRIVLNSGFRIIKNTTDWMAVWERHMKSPGFRTIRSHQKYNHMPGSFRIGRKDSMWRCIQNNMKKFGSKEFGFMQRSYIMPEDLESLRSSWPKNASKLTKWIVKPPASARGTGIRIINRWSQFPKDRPLVVQKYIDRPLLINDNKFDMRIYVVVTSINPLRIYMYKDGLARFASVKYSCESDKLDDRCMHLTNYSINKLSQTYAKNEDINACQGHKWSLQSLWSCLEKRGINTKRLWATLRNLIVRSIVSGESGLNRMYRQNVNFRYNCFELFGFDVLLDENLIPWLLEINISPSLHSELPLDLHVKGPLIQATLNTALYQVPPKLSEKQQQEILKDLNMSGPLCLDKRIYTTCLTAEEVRKHNYFTNRIIEFREEYLDSILDNLLPDDVRCLIVAEDEFARCSPMERIFPTAETYTYLRFIENSRYYNRLLDAWEHRYAHCREVGIALLSRLCEEKYHLQVSEADKEPNITVTDIDMLHSSYRIQDSDVGTIDNIPKIADNLNDISIIKNNNNTANNCSREAAADKFDRVNTAAAITLNANV